MNRRRGLHLLRESVNVQFYGLVWIGRFLLHTWHVIWILQLWVLELGWLLREYRGEASIV